MENSLFFPLLLLVLLACTSCERCPLEEDISPCKCVPLAGRINIECAGGSLKDIDDAFDNLRGKTIYAVSISNLKGDRLSSLLFWNTTVSRLSFYGCDLRGLSDSDRRPAFLGLETSLESLTVMNTIKGGNELKTLALSHLKKLNYLWLSENNIPEVGNDWFPNGPLSLTYVRILHCGMSKLGDTAFASLANLRDLQLWGNRLTFIDRSMIPNPAPHLKTLTLNSNNITSLPNDIFSGMPSLKTVYLSHNSIRRIEETIWSSVWEELDYLQLEENPLECDSHMEWLFSLRQPKILLGYCQSPDTVKRVKLSQFIENNRKKFSLE